MDLIDPSQRLIKSTSPQSILAHLLVYLLYQLLFLFLCVCHKHMILCAGTTLSSYFVLLSCYYLMVLSSYFVLLLMSTLKFVEISNHKFVATNCNSLKCCLKELYKSSQLHTLTLTDLSSSQFMIVPLEVAITEREMQRLRYVANKQTKYGCCSLHYVFGFCVVYSRSRHTMCLDSGHTNIETLIQNEENT